MDTEIMIRELKIVEEQHMNDKVLTGQLNIAEMAHDTRKRLEELKPYEDTGLTPPEVREFAGQVGRVKELFGGNITAQEIIKFFVDFYIAQSDTARVEDAILLTNEEAGKWRELKERDTEKKPNVSKDKYSDTYICPSCNYTLIHKDETGYFCGKNIYSVQTVDSD